MNEIEIEGEILNPDTDGPFFYVSRDHDGSTHYYDRYCIFCGADLRHGPGEGRLNFGMHVRHRCEEVDEFNRRLTLLSARKAEVNTGTDHVTNSQGRA